VSAATSEETAPEGGPDTAQAGRFGTFGGVFTPSILTILGVVMYLLMGKVTGQAGLGLMLIIVVVAHLLSISTGLSVSSIATNRTVGAGGAYFMISRALGAATGAAVGIPLFFAQALSVTFYIVGFTDSLVRLIPPDFQVYFPPMLISSLINVGLTVLSFKSAELAIKAQYVVMVAIIVSLVSFFAGRTAEFPRQIVWFNSNGPGFGVLFAIFFPAVTGIMAGVGMSGDLEDPRKAIPRGTLAAIFVGMVIYLAFPIWFSMNMSNADLIEHGDAVWRISYLPSLIYLGVWGATLSSALGSIMTAPRTLQALAMDGLMPRFLGKGTGPANEPRVGILLTFFLAQAGIFLGSLDAIAPVLTMFFLTTYGVVNLASGLQRWAASPSWRPSFRVPAFISLSGAFGCFYVMSVIDLGAMVAALFFCFIIWLITERRTLNTTYGDARHGIWAALVRTALQRMRRVEWHPENWRPNLVILGGNPQKRAHLLHLGNAIVQDRGIVTYFHLLRGKVKEQAPLRQELFESFDAKIAEKFANVFYRVDVVPDVFTGTVQVAQSYGVGSFEANTVMLGWSKKPERADAFIDMCRDLVDLDRSLLLVSYDEEKGFGDGKLIHIWWGGLEGNGGLMLLLAFLLTAHYRWRKAQIEVLTVVENDIDKADTERRLAKLLTAARLDAKARVVLRQRRTIAEVMHVESANADLAIIGMRIPGTVEATKGYQDPSAVAFCERMDAMLAELPTTILVQGARNFASEPVLFDAADMPESHRPPAPDAQEPEDEGKAEGEAGPQEPDPG